MKKFDAEKIFFTKWPLCELRHFSNLLFAYFYGLCVLISFSILAITVRGVSNKHCLSPFFHYELRHEKSAFLRMQKQRRRSAVRKHSTFVFATKIVQSVFFLNPKFQASSHLLWLYRLFCVGPGQKA